MSSTMESKAAKLERTTVRAPDGCLECADLCERGECRIPTFGVRILR